MTEIINSPLVSVVTPVLNGIKYLEPCLQSVLNQNYPHIEHIFVDGGSTDGTLEMLKSYQDKYPDRVRYITGQDKNAADAWNKGWQIARGDILGWLGADDTYEPNAITTVVEFCQLHPEAYFVYGDCNVIDEIKGRVTIFKAKGGNLEQLLNGPNYVATTSSFYKREVIEQIGLMQTEFNGYSCDLDYWMRVAKVFQMYHIEGILSNFRLHVDSTTGSKDAFQKYARINYINSRRHGGSIISNYCIIYYSAPMIRLLQPILGPLYPVISRRIVYPVIGWLRKIT